jgi:hypothetical protein
MEAVRKYSLTLCLVLMPLGTRAQTIGVAPPGSKIRPTDHAPKGSTALLSGAHNEFVSFELIVENNFTRAMTGVDVTVGSPTERNSSISIPTSNIWVYREAYINVQAASYPNGFPGGVGYWPDILVPKNDEFTGKLRCAFYSMRDTDNSNTGACNSACSSSCAAATIPPGQSRVFFIDILIPRSADANVPAGTYYGDVRVNCNECVIGTPGGGSVTYPAPLIANIVLQVRPFDLPSTSSLPNFYQLHSQEIAVAEGLSGDGWGNDNTNPSNVSFHVTRYAKMLLDHRLTPDWIHNMEDGANPDWDTNPNNPFDLTYAPFITGSDSFRLKGATMTTVPYHWTPLASIFAQGGAGGADARFKSQIGMWWNHFTSKGWSTSKTLINICDEPQTDWYSHNRNCVEPALFYTNGQVSKWGWQTAARLAQLAHAAQPAFKTLITTDLYQAQTCDPSSYATDFNILTPVHATLWPPNGAANHAACPPNNPQADWSDTNWDPGGAFNPNWTKTKTYTYGGGYRGNNRPDYAGTVWWYHTCNETGCGSDSESIHWYPSLAVDVPNPILHRIMQWYTYRLGINGEMYWSVTWNLPSSWRSVRDTNLGSENGDGILIYPGLTANIGVANGSGGRADDIPLASVRLKQLRNGMQDYEYLNYVSSLLHDSGAWANSKIDQLINDGNSPPSVLSAANATLTQLDIVRDEIGSKIERLVQPSTADFSLSISLSPASVAAGTNATVNVSTVLLSGSPQNITIDLVHDLFNYDACDGGHGNSINITAGQSGTLTYYTNANCRGSTGTISASGTYPDGRTHVASANLTVTASSPMFSLNAQSDAVRVPFAAIASGLGEGTLDNVSLSSVGGFSSQVALSAAVSPSGPAINFSTSTLTPSSPNSSMTVSAGAAPAGQYTVTLTGTASGTTTSNVVSYLVPYSDAAWTRQFGTTRDDFAAGVASDSAGNVLVVGSSKGDLGDYNQGFGDVVLAKYSGAGSQLWLTSIGTIADETATAVTTDSAGSAYVTGRTTGPLFDNYAGGLHDGFIVVYNAAGVELWSNTFGSVDDDRPAAIAVDGAGNIYVAGTSYRPGDPGVDPVRFWPSSGFIYKFNEWFDFQWKVQIGANGTSLEGLVVDSSGNAYVCGTTSETLGSASLGGKDTFLAKYTPAGTTTWIKQIGSSSDDTCAGVAINNAGNLAVAGSTTGSFGYTNAGGWDGWIGVYDGGTGSVSWLRQIGTTTDEFVNGVAFDAAGNVYIAGSNTSGLYSHFQGGDHDVFLAKYSATGTRQWIKNIGSAGDDTTSGVVASGTAVYLVGSTTGVLQGGTYTPGLRDIFLSSIAQ